MFRVNMKLKVRVAERAHLGAIEPFDLGFLAYADGRDQVAHLEPNVRHREREH